MGTSCSLFLAIQPDAFSAGIFGVWKSPAFLAIACEKCSKINDINRFLKMFDVFLRTVLAKAEKNRYNI